MAMQAEGTSLQDARAKIFMVDSKGLIVKDRPEGGVTGHKVKFAHARAPIKTLTEVVKTVKPSILIGMYCCFYEMVLTVIIFSIVCVLSLIHISIGLCNVNYFFKPKTSVTF